MKNLIIVGFLLLLSSQIYGKSQFLIKGSVLAQNGIPLQGLNVSVYEKKLRGEDLAGQTMTDARGSYLIKYNMNNQDSSIIIKVFDKNNKALYKTNIIRPTRNEFLRIVIPKRNLNSLKLK